MRVRELSLEERPSPLSRYVVEEEYTNVLFQKQWRPVQRFGQDAIFQTKYKAHVVYNIPL